MEIRREGSRGMGMELLQWNMERGEMARGVEGGGNSSDCKGKGRKESGGI